MNRVEYLVEKIMRVAVVVVVVVMIVVVVAVVFVGVVVVVVVVMRVLAYMMPADQENTSTPHFDLVIVIVEGLLNKAKSILVTLVLFRTMSRAGCNGNHSQAIKMILRLMRQRWWMGRMMVSPCDCHGHHAQTVDQLTSDVDRLRPEPLDQLVEAE